MPGSRSHRYRRLTTTIYSRGAMIPDDDVQQLDEESWRVWSSDHFQQYNITQVLRGCNVRGCARAERDLCQHKYTCSCPHAENPCKHIYKVHCMIYLPDGRDGNVAEVKEEVFLALEDLWQVAGACTSIDKLRELKRRLRYSSRKAKE